MIEHPNPKKSEFKNYHQMVTTVLTFDNSVTVMEQMKAEIKKVINCIMSDVFQGMYIDMCKMILSAKMVELSKYHKNIKQNELKGNPWINMLAGLTHPQIFFKKHLNHGLTKREWSSCFPNCFQRMILFPLKVFGIQRSLHLLIIRIEAFHG